MARNKRKYAFSRFLGVNEALEGDSSLKGGEAAIMRNFAVTPGGALIKRAGCKSVMSLKELFNAVPSGEAWSEVEIGSTAKTMELYPRLSAGDGTLALEGNGETCSYLNASELEGYYGEDESLGFYRFKSCETAPRGKVGEEKYGFLGSASSDYNMYVWFCLYDSVKWDGSKWELSGVSIKSNPPDSVLEGKYMVLDDNGRPISVFSKTAPSEEEFSSQYNTSGRFASVRLDPEKDCAMSLYPDIYVNGTGYYWCYYIIADEFSETRYTWSFEGMKAVENPSTDTEVKALWSGFVGGREVLCAAGNGHLWELFFAGGEWEKASCGELDTSGSVHLFGFEGKLYIMNGSQYKVWDGKLMEDVEGYRPLVTVAASPSGGGTSLEQVNKLSGKRRMWFSPDGASAVFTLPEKGIESVDWVKSTVTGEALTGFTADLEEGTVTFETAPEAGVDTLEIGWTYPESARSSVLAMRYSELYNGAQDTRVFIYGDGGSKAFYSGLDYNGRARADYFPDLNECAVGDENTPITAMIRHYNRLLCFKKDSTWSISYDTLSLADGAVTAGFYITPVNRSIGSCAYGEVCLVENRPRTLDGRSVIEWRSTSSSGNVTADTRNAERISQRVDSTIRSFNLEKAVTFYDKITHEYYVIEGGTAIVNGVENDVWYIYTDFDARCMVNYRDEVYFGSGDGMLRHFSRDYLSDDGETIDCYWESGAMSFGDLNRRKYSAETMLGVKAEEDGYLVVTCMTDRKAVFCEYFVTPRTSGEVPEAERVKLKPGKFTYMKLAFGNNTCDKRATVVEVEIGVESAGKVKSKSE